MSLKPRQLVSLPRPPETQPWGPGLILLHHITILINVTDYALGKSGPQSRANRPKCLLACKCEKSECPLVLSHLCLRSFWRLCTDLWHLILCQKWISILFGWWFCMWEMCLCLHSLTCCVSVVFALRSVVSMLTEIVPKWKLTSYILN